MARPVFYIIILVLAAIVAYAYKLRTEGIFACGADGYYASSDAYLAYCHASAYGDYDHGAVWFGLEPEAQYFAANAEVLFVGSSRMQFAFSTTATDEWFSAAAVPHYLLGFSHTENLSFIAPLLQKLKPRAKVYVINVDRLFDEVETGPGSEVLHRAGAARHYKEKKLWQPAHRLICTRLPAVCGNQHAFFRSREHGHWTHAGTPESAPTPTAEDAISKQDQWGRYASLAEEFISKLPVGRSCVLLTIVPSSATKGAEAQAIADAVGLDLVNPRLAGLRTFDGSHLDSSAAERWSKAFFDAAGPRILRCLGRDGRPAVPIP